MSSIPIRLFPFGLVVALIVLPGCSRKHWRQRADNDVTGVITQKNIFPDWQVRNWNVYPDPRARYADNTNPDRPPYQPDDYASRVLAPNPQRPRRRAGVGRQEGNGYVQYLTQWDAENRAAEAGVKEVPQPEKLPDPRMVEPAPAAQALPLAPTPLPTPTTSVVLVQATQTQFFLKWKPWHLANAIRSSDLTGRSITAEMLNLESPSLAEVKIGQFQTANPDKTVAPRAPSSSAQLLPPVQQHDQSGTTQGPLKGPSIEEMREGTVIPISGAATSGGQAIPALLSIPALKGAPVANNIQGSSVTQEPQKAPGSKGGEKQPNKGDDDPIRDDMGSGAVAAAAGFFAALTTTQPTYRIRIDQAIQLGTFNSREYQDRREDLYLAALPVTLERFNLAALGFFTETAAMDFAGRALGRLPRNGVAFNTTPSLSKLFPTGALLAVKLANSVVVDLSGDKPTTTLSNFSLNLIQPFLQGGGRAVTLEPLTLAERNMVYAMRSYARFRKLYYVAVAAGGGITNNPYGLQGLAVNLGRGIGGNLTAPSVGFLPILAVSANISNQRRNVASLESLLRLYQAFREGGQQSDLQVSQVEQQLLGVRNSLLGSSNVVSAGGGGANPNGGLRAYLDAVDNFKLQLGLPLTVGLELDQTPLKPIHDQLLRFDAVYAQIKDVEALARRYEPAAPAAQLRARYRQLFTSSSLAQGTRFAKRIGARWAVWEKLNGELLAKRLADLADERRQLLDRKADRLLKGQPDPIEETKRIEVLNADLDLGSFERAMRAYEAQPWAREKGGVRKTVQAASFRDAFNSFFQVLLEARNDRLESVRKQWPQLPAVIVDGVNLLEVPLDDAMTTSMQSALSNRLDLMNARGQVVDAWRQIKVQANALRGVFNVQYNLNATTPTGGSNPVGFSGSRTDHNLVFSAELPLVRRAERNNYRAALISYQRQRRNLQAFEDNIANDVRSDTRELRTIAQLYRVQQRLVEIGYFQVDNAEALLLAPPAPGEQTNAASAAALTQQVLNAQSQWLSAQNQLYSIWVNFLSSRMIYYVDLEKMQIDEQGVWINEPLPGNEVPAVAGDAEPRGERLPAPRPIPDR